MPRRTYYYVIMGNDYPSGVCSTQEKADAAVQLLKENDRIARKGTIRANGPGIHYRWYEFKIDALNGTKK